MEKSQCVDCGKPVEAYRKSNMCEKCYEAILQEELEELAEKTRSTWFIKGGKTFAKSVGTVPGFRMEFGLERL